MDERALITLVKKLIALKGETEWVEFKCNNINPEEIGEYLSAISNSAALHHCDKGFIVWGIDDVSHQIIGTEFKPRKTKIGNEELENWLTHLLFPRMDFRIHELTIEGRPIVLFEVQPAFHTPVRFREYEFIRVGSYKKKLKDHPEKERALWTRFTERSFERGIALSEVTAEQVVSLIDIQAYFELLRQSFPVNRNGIINRLILDKIIIDRGGGLYDITNYGALLFAKLLENFDTISRKSLRVVIYKGMNRIETIKEQPGMRGYAVGFEGLIRYINDQLPRNEVLGQALRNKVMMYPEIAIRELVANALIHQDLSITGTGPLVEIFTDRIEITNPGMPLIDPLRFMDEPPQSRNEKLAKLMRHVNICEERGSGIDKVIFQVELFQLPAPDFQVTSNHTKVILFAHKKLSAMDRNDRIRACYQHACLCKVSNIAMTNTTLRKRFNIEKTNYPIASKVIAETLEVKLIKPLDPESTSKKLACYVPFWA
jgi:ATP-dependent DNA helicase RecG